MHQAVFWLSIEPENCGRSDVAERREAWFDNQPDLNPARLYRRNGRLNEDSPPAPTLASWHALSDVCAPWALETRAIMRVRMADIGYNMRCFLFVEKINAYG
ncbi:hypothetical protein HK16_18995 [Acetobacter senegalensis]|uniref:Uncharacterized protein n=2 Tax=Acetobacter TaxID=434 RepID=A0A252EF51_9PROT|nr:hypothetical protein CIW82_00025 [Acetobacter tropicalis]OUL65098.1 hypothetical protein HK16_18995 [Acetobacter senegalensis]